MTRLQRWRDHERECRAAGTCAWCAAPAADPGGIRCVAHKEENRKRARAWRRAHPCARAALKAVWRAQGRCDICPEHRKLAGRALHCRPCLRMFRRLGHRYYREVTKPTREAAKLRRVVRK